MSYGGEMQQLNENFGTVRNNCKLNTFNTLTQPGGEGDILVKA